MANYTLSQRYMFQYLKCWSRVDSCQKRAREHGGVSEASGMWLAIMILLSGADLAEVDIFLHTTGCLGEFSQPELERRFPDPKVLYASNADGIEADELPNDGSVAGIFGF